METKLDVTELTGIYTYLRLTVHTVDTKLDLHRYPLKYIFTIDFLTAYYICTIDFLTAYYIFTIDFLTAYYIFTIDFLTSY